MRRIDNMLALIGGIWGTMCAVFFVGIRVANTHLPMIRAEWFGNLAFLAIYLTPFALSLFALRWQRMTVRAGVWLAAGLLALMASFTAFSGVSLIFLPSAPLLIVAASIAFIRAQQNRVLTIVIAPILIIFTIVAGMTILITTPGQGRCWQLVQPSEGAAYWERIPYNQQHTLEPNSDVVRVECTSDIISPAESAVALGVLAIGTFGVVFLQRYGLPPFVDPPQIKRV